ncbi:magnesium transporter [Micromonospora kangleipakensis]|uniref:Magnesium transporter n=1 Tax=Micromonospora kangleipakensis TaxID=1077942 RepID=A0A4Q8BDV9_9ACTN|nr:magnesium transporter CorA family protein [Micromonospora kangleipakensis]RZU76104.1 magnesium transporter [Micromonospora kangleipakensis]
MNRTRLYCGGHLVDENFPPDEVSTRLGADEDAVAWLDLCHPTAEELNLVAAEFGLHQLAVKSVVEAAQRAKLDRYDTHLFLTSYMVRLDPDGGVSANEMAAFITPRALITVRQDDSFDIDELLLRWDENAELAEHGVAFLLHGLLDLIVDCHFTAVQQLDSTFEKLEDKLFEDKNTSLGEVQRRALHHRRDLVRLRQVALPMREVVNSVMRPTMHIVDAPMLPYYQDVYDHILRVIEWTESLRDLITTMLDANLMVQSNQMNLTVKKVTSWAAIIAVPTAITSFFGQNLAFPWRHTDTEFYLTAALTVGLAFVLYVVFRRKSWL